MLKVVDHALYIILVQGKGVAAGRADARVDEVGSKCYLRSGPSWAANVSQPLDSPMS